jgi:hypothetical protein
VISLLLAACSGDRTGEHAPGPVAGSDEIVLVNRAILFSREESGVSDGFDLDDAVTATGDPTGCGVGDFLAPDGTPGVDNAFARMLPALESTEAVAVESLIQQTINMGELLLMARISGIDDPLDDDAVDVEVFRGIGAPLLGSDGKMLPSQTFAFDGDTALTTATDVPLVDGTVQADGLEIALPIQIFDVFLDMRILDASYRITAPTAEGEPWAGLMGGGVETSAIQSVADEENVDDALSGVVAALLAANADLSQSDAGGCAQLSMTFRTEMVESFLYPE